MKQNKMKLCDRIEGQISLWGQFKSIFPGLTLGYDMISYKKQETNKKRNCHVI